MHSLEEEGETFLFLKTGNGRQAVALSVLLVCVGRLGRLFWPFLALCRRGRQGRAGAVGPFVSTYHCFSPYLPFRAGLHLRQDRQSGWTLPPASLPATMPARPFPSFTTLFSAYSLLPVLLPLLFYHASPSTTCLLPARR